MTALANHRSLAEYLAPMGRVLLGYSGGIDSSVLAVAATRALGADNFLAVLGVSPSLGKAQHQRALDLADRFGVPLREVATDELSDPGYSANPLNRCYFCKRTLWRALGEIVRAEGFDALIDGTNHDDLNEHRPGALAGSEREVRTPLADLGWSKADVRAQARLLRIPDWNAPATPCLASRIRPHLEVTAGRLAQIEAAEQLLRRLGVVGDLRVRHHDRLARIEVSPEMFSMVDQILDADSARFTELGFEAVERDQAGYRRGSLTVLAG